MSVTARKYNPGFLSDEELVASFCVRTHEFASIVEMLRECTGSSNTHQIVIGPRGSGKTSLLLRVAAEVRRDSELRSAFFPIVFAEESYEVSTAGEFWLESLGRLVVQAPRRDEAPDLSRTIEELRTLRDDRMLGDRCLGTLQDFSDREGKRLVLVVENLNMMFRDMSDPDAGWRLRHTLQTEPRIVLLASATSRFDEIDDPEHALYEQFRVLQLRPLDTNECAVLWETVSGRCPPPEKIRALEILTGGSPRLLTIVARFGEELSLRDLMTNLLDLVDDHTEYFKSHLEALPAQERRVYLALAALWKPATAREISNYARMEISKCSAQLTRLTGRGVVQSAGGSAWRRQYYLTERLYNIYYLLRRSGRTDRLVEALIHFMESYYSPSELKDIGARMVRESESFPSEMHSVPHAAIKRLMELPAMTAHGEELLAMMPERLEGLAGRAVTPAHAPRATQPVRESGVLEADDPGMRTDDEETSGVRQLFESVLTLRNEGGTEEALAACDAMADRHGKSGNKTVRLLVAGALFMKARMLRAANRPEDALGAYDEVMRRFEGRDVPPSDHLAPSALLDKGGLLVQLNRLHDAQAAYDEVVLRFGDDEDMSFAAEVAEAIVRKGVLLYELRRPKDSPYSHEEIVRRLDDDVIPHLVERVAGALAASVALPAAAQRSPRAVATLDKLVQVFSGNDVPNVVGDVIFAILETRGLRHEVKSLNDLRAACETVVRRFEGDSASASVEHAAQALVIKGRVHHRLGQRAVALASYGEAVQKYRTSRNRATQRWVEEALLGVVEVELERRNFEVAAETIARSVELGQTFLERRLQDHLIKADRALVNDDRPGSERHLEAALTLVSEIDSLPKDSLDALMHLCVVSDPLRLRELIAASPSEGLLLPLATALDLEVGREPRVANEVREVAEDIRRDLDKLKRAGADGDA